MINVSANHRDIHAYVSEATNCIDICTKLRFGFHDLIWAECHIKRSSLMRTEAGNQSMKVI